MIDLYAILGVARNANEKTIQKAYRRLARLRHPDCNPGDENAAAEFQKVQQAWEILGDPARRQRYDATGDISGLAPDNSMVVTMGILANAMAGVMNDLLAAGRNPQQEDMIAQMRTAPWPTAGKN